MNMPAGAQAEAGFQVNRRLALVCADAPERQGAVQGALQQLGYVVYLAKSADDAVERVRKEPYDVVVLDEQFQGGTPLDNPVLRAIRVMPMSVRRHMFVALLGREFKTFDNMMAFAQSANVVVNVNDLPHLPVVLQRAIAENDEFYRTFRTVLQEAGRR